jgi:hypothetical protein
MAKSEALRRDPCRGAQQSVEKGSRFGSKITIKRSCFSHRRNRSGRSISGRAAAKQRLRRTRNQATILIIQHGRVDHIYQDLHEQEVNFAVHYGDLTDATNLIRIVQEVQPTEIYNLAALRATCKSHSKLLNIRRMPMPWARCASSSFTNYTSRS